MDLPWQDVGRMLDAMEKIGSQLERIADGMENLVGEMQNATEQLDIANQKFEDFNNLMQEDTETEDDGPDSASQ